VIRDAEELQRLVENDLAVLITERFGLAVDPHLSAGTISMSKRRFPCPHLDGRT
jgi:hypothetical protein